jgi:hypothetical protein
MLWDGGEREKIKVMKISRKPSTLQIMIDQKRPENVEYFKCLGSPITNDTRRRLKEGRLTGLVTSCVGTALQNAL